MNVVLAAKTEAAHPAPKPSLTIVRTDPTDEPANFVCFTSLEECACLWLTFQQQAAATAYHSHQWADAWQSTVGAKLKAQPRIIAAFGASGALLFILPLQIRRKAGLSVLEWQGTPDAPYGHGLFAKAFLPRAGTWFADNLDHVLASAGTYDVLSLSNMPETMFGHPHPLRFMFNLATANETYVLRLADEFDAVYRRKRNPETRRANRRKDNRLVEAGLLEFRLVTDPHDLKTTIDTMLEHKVARLAAEGIHGVFDREVCEMVRRLAFCEPRAKPLFSTHALSLDGQILACTFGGRLNGTYSFFVSSIIPDNALTKHSPGDLALRKTIAWCCEAGLQEFDFGAGSAAYKTGWTDETIRLYSTTKSCSTTALPFAVMQTGWELVKGWIKRHALLKRLAFSLRRRLKGRQ